MANTKHSAAREIIIDRLLRERRGYSIQEMLDIVNYELEQEGFRPVSKSTIRNDIHNFQYLFRMRLHVEKHSYREYFMYEDPECTMFQNLLTFGEMQHLHSALQSIRFLDGVQGTLMYKQLSDRLCSLLNVETAHEPVVIYDTPPTLNTMRKFQVLYEYIRTQTPADISYRTMNGELIKAVTVHPYYLRQKGLDWYLLGHDEAKDKPTEIPILAITNIHMAEGTEFVPNKDFDLKDYYKELNSAA